MRAHRTPCTGVLYASPFHSLSLFPLHLSLSLSYLSLPFYISPSTFLSLSLFSFSLSSLYHSLWRIKCILVIIKILYKIIIDNYLPDLV